MSCFRELYARFPDGVWRLCFEEATHEGRPVYEFDPEEIGPGAYPCEFCERPCAYDVAAYLSLGGERWVLVDMHVGRDATCGDALCRELAQYFWAPKGKGGKRRREFLDFFGKPLWDTHLSVRREMALTVKLHIEVKRNAKEKANVGKPRQRVAA